MKQHNLRRYIRLQLIGRDYTSDEATLYPFQCIMIGAVTEVSQAGAAASRRNVAINKSDRFHHNHLSHSSVQQPHRKTKWVRGV